MKIALLQINPTVGDLAGNARLILDALRAASASGADLAATPELALVGYLPRDLLLNAGFVRRSWDALEPLARDAAGAAAGAGRPARAEPVGRRAAALQQRRAAARRPGRAALPQGAAADLRRLRRGPLLRAVSRRRSCSTSPARASGSASARTSGTIAISGSGAATITIRSTSSRAPAPTVVLNMSASPFTAGKHRRREEMLGGMALKHRAADRLRQPVRRQRRPRLRRPQRDVRRRRRGVARGRSFDADVVICDLDHGARRSRQPRISTSNPRSGARSCSARATTSASAASRASCSVCRAASTRR